MKILVVLRRAGERTADLAKSLAEAQTDVVVVEERPFFRAVVKTFQVGDENPEYDWLLALDADVLLHDVAIKNIVGWLSRFDNDLLRADFRVADKFRGTVYAGCHAYNNRYSAAVLEILASPSFEPGVKRPESSSMRLVKNKLGLKSMYAKNEPAGRHDFEQFYRHVYVKYYNRAIRDAKALAEIKASIGEKLEGDPSDMDFAVALAGLDAGAGRPELDIRLDWGAYPDAFPVMAKLGLSEKATL
jgi:hypothetical protein